MEVFLVHLGSRIANDLSAFGQEAVVEQTEESWERLKEAGRRGQTVMNGEAEKARGHGEIGGIDRRTRGFVFTFFLARSPEAPRTTMMVLSTSWAELEPPEDGISEAMFCSWMYGRTGSTAQDSSASGGTRSPHPIIKTI